jgi:hypothetical protein
MKRACWVPTNCTFDDSFATTPEHGLLASVAVVCNVAHVGESASGFIPWELTTVFMFAGSDFHEVERSKAYRLPYLPKGYKRHSVNANVVKFHIKSYTCDLNPIILHDHSCQVVVRHSSVEFDYHAYGQTVEQQDVNNEAAFFRRSHHHSLSHVCVPFLEGFAKFVPECLHDSFQMNGFGFSSISRNNLL